VSTRRSNRNITKTKIPSKLFLPWNNDHFVRFVGDFEELIQIPHDTLKGITHEIERAIGVNDGILLEGAEIFLANDAVVESIRSRRKAAAAAG
jgi:hypothetical protein